MANVPPHEPIETEQWEYYVNTYEKLRDMQAELDKLGQDGWEAVNVTSNTVQRYPDRAGALTVPHQAILWTVLMKRRL